MLLRSTACCRVRPMKNLKKVLLSVALFLSTSTFACSISEIQSSMNSIRRHVEVHPNAADTLEGIHHYWIEWPTSQLPHISCTFVALTELETEGLMERFQFSNRELWRRRR